MRKMKRSTFIDALRNIRDEYGTLMPVCVDYYHEHLVIDRRCFVFERDYDAIIKFFDDNGVKYRIQMCRKEETDDYHGMTEYPVIIIANSNFKEYKEWKNDDVYYRRRDVCAGFEEDKE